MPGLVADGMGRPEILAPLRGLGMPGDATTFRSDHGPGHACPRPPRKTWSVLAFVMALMPLLACCAAPSSSGVVPAREINTRFDGWYRGQRLPVSDNLFCRDRPRKIWFRVERGGVEVLTGRHRRARLRPLLSGTVSVDGVVALGREAGHFATGRIEGDQLTAADLPTAVAEPGSERSACLHRYEAVRRGTTDED